MFQHFTEHLLEVPDADDLKVGLDPDLDPDLDHALQVRAEAIPSLVTSTKQGEVLRRHQSLFDRAQGNFYWDLFTETDFVELFFIEMSIIYNLEMS